jgi:ubiquinone/menaquinone biosynthesis C-methylase UbiE
VETSKEDQQNDLLEQYRTSSNLNARIRLHQRFSINHYGWHRWVFDQFKLPSECQILELGCGAGDLWLENQDMIPEGWQILLTDFSEGMLQQAQARLQTVHPFQFEHLDAQSAPYRFESGSFHAVIANHMLYHLSNSKATLAEIQRILKPGGHLYATTIGEKHLQEIKDMLVRFDPGMQSWGYVADSFTLENGEEQLQEWFSHVEQRWYEDGLKVTEAAPLVEYILSGWTKVKLLQEKAFSEFVEQELKNHGGKFFITKDSGIFVAVRD